MRNKKQKAEKKNMLVTVLLLIGGERFKFCVNRKN